MPTSPFGLGYGIGVAANAIPTQMNQRQNEALMTQMRGLQLQQMQRQEAQQEALQQAGQAVRPETESVANLSQDNVTPKLITSGNATPAIATQDTTTLGVTAKGLNLPASPGAIPNAPTADQMAQVKKPLATHQVAKTYTTPYQAAAYRYGAMADYLFKQGMVEPAMRLQQQAQQASQMHQTTTLSLAARMASVGNYGDATKMLNGLGMNVTGMSQSPDDPNTVQIHSTQNGQPVVADITRRFLGAMIEDPVKAVQAQGIFDWRNDNIDIKRKAQKARDKAQADLMRHRLVMEQTARTNAQNRLNAPGQIIQQVERRKANIIALAKESGQPIPSDADAENQAWNFVKSSAASTGKDPELANSWKVVNSIQRANQGMEPEPPAPGTDPNSPEARQYAEWKQAHDVIMDRQRSGFKRGPAAPKTGTPQPKQNYEGEISPSGAYKFSGGKWIPNK